MKKFSTQEDTRRHISPPRINKLYTDFNLISRCSYYRVYQAKYSLTNEIHTIRMLDTECMFVKRNPEFASSLFIKEILFLCSRLGQPDSIVIENFEMSEGKIAFVSKNYSTVLPLKPNESKPNVKKMLKDIVQDIDFLYSKMNIRNLTIDPSRICRFQDTDKFFYTDWAAAEAKGEEEESKGGEIRSIRTPLYFAPELRNNSLSSLPKAATEIYTLGLTILELSGIERRLWDELPLISDDKSYDYVLSTMIMKKFCEEQKFKPLQNLVQSMLQKDPLKRVKFQDLMLGTSIDKLDYFLTKDEGLRTEAVPIEG